MRIVIATIAAASVWWAGVSPAFAYVFTGIDVAGATETRAFGINDAGWIVGSFIQQGASHGFVRAPDGSLTTFDRADARFTELRGINSLGQIVGYGDTSAFVREADGYTIAINVPNAIFTRAFGLNDLGQVVGDYAEASGMVHGFVWDRGTQDFMLIDGPNPDTHGTQALGTNGVGEIVGVSGGRPIAFVRDSSGGITTIDLPGSTVVTPWSINSNHDIAGVFSDNQGQHAFLLNTQEDLFVSLDAPLSSRGTQAYGINSRREIVGINFSSDGVAHAFLATPGPVPGPVSVIEPSTGLLLLIGGSAMGIAKPRTRPSVGGRHICKTRLRGL